MVLDVFKNAGNKSINTSNIMSEIRKKYDYNRQVFIVKALRKLIEDEVVSDINGNFTSFKLNTEKGNKPPTPSKKVLAAKKTTATAKRALKKTTKNDQRAKHLGADLKVFMSEQLYNDLCAIGAEKLIGGRACKNGRNTYIGRYEHGNCFYAALTLGHMKIDPRNGAKEMEKVMFEGKCPGCKKDNLKATVKQLCDQSDSCRMSWGAKIKCNTCKRGYFLTNMCKGEPVFDTISHHCGKCPGMGVCIGDPNLSHCTKCGNHYVWGGPGGCWHCGHKEARWMWCAR